MAEDIEDIRQRLRGDRPRVTSGAMGRMAGEISQSVEDIKSKLINKDPDVDQSGVQDFWFRAGLSRMDSPAEREAYLTRTVGPAGWNRDKFGNYTLTMKGQSRRGMKGVGRDLIIDELEPTWSDIGDVAGSAPPVLGAVGAGMMTTGAGAAVGIPAVMAGAALGKIIDEIIEGAAGQNLQTPGEVALDIAEEAVYAAAGEGVFRGLIRPLGRKIMAPHKKRMTDEMRVLAKEARAMGTKPSISQITKPPILGRMQGMIDRIFGDRQAVQNSRALNKEIARLKAKFIPAAAPEITIGGRKLTLQQIRVLSRAEKLPDSPYLVFDARTTGGYEGIFPTSREAKAFIARNPKKRFLDFGTPREIETWNPSGGESAEFIEQELRDLIRQASVANINIRPKLVDTGEAVAGSISRGRSALAKWAKGVTQNIDRTAAAEGIDPKFVPTARLKEQAREIMDALPKAEGEPVFTGSDMLKSLNDALALDERVTMSEMQAIGQKLFEAIGDDTIIPGVSGRNARLLWRASKDSYDDIGGNLQPLVTEFRKRYAKEISRFDNALVERIMRNPRLAGRIEPETIVENVFRKGATSKVNRLKNAVNPGTWQRVQRAAMDDILDNLTQRTDDPLLEIFAGKKFLETLDKYGRETLSAMFDSVTVRDLYKLGRVTQLVTQRQAMSGGLVVANISLHPLMNLPRLVKLRILGSFLETPFAVRWLTEGLSAPKTRAGAEALSRFGTFMATLAEQHTTSEAAIEGN